VYTVLRTSHSVELRIVFWGLGLVIKIRSQASMSCHKSEWLHLELEMAAFEYGKLLKNHSLCFMDTGVLC